MGVEIAGSGCCEHIHDGVSERDATAFVEDSRSANDHDGSCVHIPLSGGSAGILSTSKKVCLSPTISGNVAVVRCLPPQVSELKLALESSELTTFFTPLRSVILLT